MDKEEYTDEITKFKVFEKFVTKEINEFIVSINPDTNIIKKRKYYIFKFYIDVDLIFVYGSFNEYNETDYNFILKNNYCDYDEDFDAYTYKREDIECNFELEGLLYVDRIILNEINFIDCKNYNIFNKKCKIRQNIDFVKNALHLETLKYITEHLDEERCNFFNKYEKNITDMGGFIICIEDKNNKYIIYKTRNNITNTIIDLYKSTPTNLEERIIVNKLQNFDFNNDKIKFLKYFVDESEIYQKYLFYKRQYD
jgi:hypothetical protein